jgi:DNA invertase Pin-like site-specific DNA recombinase
MMKAAIGYTRISDRGANGSELSLQRQAEEIQAWCIRNGYELVDTFSDVGKSGRKLQRDGLHSAIKECSLRKATLIAFSLDRIARDQKVLERLKAEKVAFRALDVVDASEISLDMLMFFSKMYSQMVSAKMKRYHLHRKELVEKGVAKPHPLPEAKPDPIKSRANAEKARAKHVQQSKTRNDYAWEKIEPLHKDGLSTRVIAKNLNEKGFYGASGKPWNHVSVCRIIKSKVAV